VLGCLESRLLTTGADCPRSDATRGHRQLNGFQVFQVLGHLKALLVALVSRFPLVPRLQFPNLSEICAEISGTWRNGNVVHCVGILCAAVEIANNAMKSARVIAVSLLFGISAFPQDSVPTFKANTSSALVWDSNSPDNASSSLIWDPLTGREIHKLSSGGVEVSSIVGYERVSLSRAGPLLNYTTTIANNTASDISVQYGGVSIDGHAALPLWIALTNKRSNKHDRKEIWELSKMYCFKTGFASSENFFSGDAPSRTFTVLPKSAVTISSVTQDPRHSPLRCSLEGCRFTGTIRYYINVKRKDYVFVWPGRSVVYCGQ
jgi:hypothetical protein